MNKRQLSDVNKALQSDPVIRALWHDIEQANLRHQQSLAEANPHLHKLSRTFSGPMRVSGYFLSWVEHRYKNGTGNRKQWAARKQRKAAKAIAVRRFNAHEAKHRTPEVTA